MAVCSAVGSRTDSGSGLPHQSRFMNQISFAAMYMAMCIFVGPAAGWLVSSFPRRYARLASSIAVAVAVPVVLMVGSGAVVLPVCLVAIGAVAGRMEAEGRARKLRSVGIASEPSTKTHVHVLTHGDVFDYNHRCSA